ncbi:MULTISPECIES: WbqC family protein [unclassified Streptomyces]|uniref:WbqC family protein n=1 Tax=unclassified Streptomyces TaxID=2593676 RepID=UPI0029B8ACCA|nr:MULTISPECIES: WbqC family protein [unclassified Streptomyces]MDX3434384.1 WbqC family protein [Streptomyces sp. ME01-18a]MDX3686473.1 WbqC family protein [Streptomyces sp. AK04-4c]
MERTNCSSTTVSPVDSSLPDLPDPGGLCAIHQPNLFPRLTTLAKLFAADHWIVLDDVQFTRRDYQHRARLGALDEPNRSQWLTIPTRLPHGRSTVIRDALIDDPDRARRKTAGVLRQRYGPSPHWPALAQALAPVLDAFGTGRTAHVAAASTRVLLGLLGWQGQILTSSDLPSRPGRSQRLADLSAVTGARAYMCGTGGMAYLDPAPFAAEGIAVTPFQPPTTGIWSSSRRISALWALAVRGPLDVTACMQTLALDHSLPKGAA